MELLLFLVRRKELDVYNLPVSEVVDEYIAYVEFMKKVDLELAGEYLVMASTLLQLKAKSLLPKIEEEFPGLSAQQELEEMLVEYERYYELSRYLMALKKEEENYYPRGTFPNANRTSIDNNEQNIKVNYYEFLKTVVSVFSDKATNFPVLFDYKEAIEKRIDEILPVIRGKSRLTFKTLLHNTSTFPDVVLTFIALLELAKQQIIGISQRIPFTTIWIWRRKRNGK